MRLELPLSLSPLMASYPKAIADKLGISDRTVRSYLRQSGATAYEGVQDLAKAA
jgi:hypothetical protein